MKLIRVSCENGKVWEKAQLANYPWDRMRGLLGRKSLQEEDLMILPYSSSIHTFFMKFPIDLVFLDRSKAIRKVVRALKPWKLSAESKSYFVLEMKAGLSKKYRLTPGLKFFWGEEAQVTLELTLLIAVLILALISVMPAFSRAFQQYVSQLLRYMADI